MSSLVKLIRFDGTAIFVNASRVLLVEPGVKDDRARLRFPLIWGESGYPYFEEVRGSAEAVAAALDAAAGAPVVERRTWGQRLDRAEPA